MRRELSPKVLELFNEYKEFKNSDMLQTMALTMVRMAAEMEEYAFTEDSALGSMEVASIMWDQYDLYAQTLLSQDPESAFDFGLQAVQIERNIDERYMFGRWINGVGMALICENGLLDSLAEYLTDADQSALTRAKIMEALKFQTDHLDKMGVYTTPDSFAKMMALMLVFRLEDKVDASLISDLREVAEQQMQNADMKRVLNYYSELSGTQYINDELVLRLPN